MESQDYVVTLKAGHAVPDKLAFVQAEVIPARAMMIYQIRANVPGLGEVDVLVAPPLAEGLVRLNGPPDNFNGNASFSMGAAFLAPFVNRVRGKFLPASCEIETQIATSTIRLQANGRGKAPGAEVFAIHGLLLRRKARVTGTFSAGDGESVHATLDANDFGGRWPSSLCFDFNISLTSGAFSAVLTATNTGSEPTPVGLGWHPYFNLPSGDRRQARMRLPARARLPVNNYDEVLPTGEIALIRGTNYDFSPAGGRALDGLYLDDCFVDLIKGTRGETVCEIIDAAAAYGLRIISDSPEITALQTYAPPNRALVVIEPQFSWADPYGCVWPPGVETGMVLLQSGGSVAYRVTLELFRP